MSCTGLVAMLLLDPSSALIGWTLACQSVPGQSLPESLLVGVGTAVDMKLTEVSALH